MLEIQTGVSVTDYYFKFDHYFKFKILNLSSWKMLNLSLHIFKISVASQTFVETCI